MSSGSVDLGQTFGSGGGGGGVTSLNSMTGAITLIPGTGISITPGSGSLTISSTVSSLVFTDSLVNNSGVVTLVNDSSAPGDSQYYGTNSLGTLGYYTLPMSSGGTVTSVSVVSANGFAATIATPTTTPAITIETTITGILQGNGTAISAATTTGSGNVVLATSPTLVTPNLGTPSTLVGTNITGTGSSFTAGNINATSNSTLTTLSALSLPTSQLSGTISLTSQVNGMLPIANGGTGSATTSQNFAFIGPTSGSGAPSFRALVAGDIPSLSGLYLPLTGGTLTGALNINVASIDALTINSTALVFDSTNTALGIGIQPATNVALDIVNSSGTSKAIQTTSYGAGSTIPFRGRFARGTPSLPAAAQSGDNLSVLSGRGYGTSQFATASTGAINIVAGETFTNTSNATYLQFEVTNTGSVTLSEAMRVSPAGNLLIGTTTDSGTQKLQVNGNSNVGTVTGGTWEATDIGVIYGGTGVSTVPTNGELLIGNGTGYTVANVTAGNGITVTNGAGSITIASTAPYNYTVVSIASTTSATSGTTYLANTSGGAFTLTLPAPSSGAYILIKDVTGSFATNNLTIAPHASEQIEGLAANYLAQTNYGSLTLVSDGTNWWFI
jgi:hypothetical protein